MEIIIIIIMMRKRRRRRRIWDSLPDLDFLKFLVFRRVLFCRFFSEVAGSDRSNTFYSNTIV